MFMYRLAALTIFLSNFNSASAQCTTTTCSPCASSCSCGCQTGERELRPFISNSCDLDCDFDKPCRWRNGTSCEDDFDWPISTAVVLDSWHSIPRGRDGPCDPFAYTRGAFGMKHADNRAILISDPIQCQIGDGMLKFWYWKTALYPSLRVCIRKPAGSCGTLDCLATIHGLHKQEWNMKTVTIHEQKEPFEIVFEAKFKHTFDIIGLDKLSYSARLCEPAQPITTPRPPPLTPILPLTPIPEKVIGLDTNSPRTLGYTLATPAVYGPQPIGPPPTPYAAPGQRPLNDALCSATNCAFDRGSVCSYATGGPRSVTSIQLPPGASMRQWRVTSKETSNSLTGIFADMTGSGMYAYAGETTNNLDMFLLESPPFTISSPSQLDFNYYLAGIQGRLRGCINGLVDCRFESSGKDIKSDARRWRRGSFQLDPGTYTVNFVGDNLGKNYVIGLDNVELKSPSGAQLSCT